MQSQGLNENRVYQMYKLQYKSALRQFIFLNLLKFMYWNREQNKKYNKRNFRKILLISF